MPEERKALSELLRSGLSAERSNTTGRQYQRLVNMTAQRVLDDAYGVLMCYQLLMRHTAMHWKTLFEICVALMLVYVIKRCSGGRRIRRFVARVGCEDDMLDFHTYIEIVTAVNPLNQVDRNSLGKCTHLLRLHPVWKDGDEADPLLKDPFFCDLLRWCVDAMVSGHVTCCCNRALAYAMMTSLSRS